MTAIAGTPYGLLRRDLAAFLGDGEFRKFVRQLRRASRLLYWQEQSLARFAALHPEHRVEFGELLIALRVCEVHGDELQPDVVEVASGWAIRLKPDETAKNKLFPNGAFGPVYGNEVRFPDRIARVWYCPACRQAKTDWRIRRKWSDAKWTGN